jgi:prolyl-tRNA synthetase
MRMSQMFGMTLRDNPKEAQADSHALLLRAAFIRQLGAGLFTLMPFGKRSIDKIENIIREEMNAIDGQEITMPVVNPGEIWKESGRWYQVGSEMSRFVDRVGRDMCLAMTHEEVMTTLIRSDVRSYKQLPMMVYHIQTKWRDDPRPRAGLIRVREFTMKDSYTLDLDEDGLDVQYRRHYQAYYNIFNRCNLPSISVRSDVGMMGGKMAHEFMYLTSIGEDTLILCEQCGYGGNRQVADFVKPPAFEAEPLPMEKVETPHCDTVAELVKFLGMELRQAAKALMLTVTVGEEDEEKFVLAVVRGDMDLNETKLANLLGAKEMRPATEAEIIDAGLVPGYASPVGLKKGICVVDDVIPDSPNLVGGANEAGYHIKNLNYDRDYKADHVADIAAAAEGFGCISCGGTLGAVRGVEIGNIFKLGTRYSESMGAYYLDQNGKKQPVVMGSYGIGSGRLLACVAEEHNDDKGMILPISIAPYEVHMVLLSGKKQTPNPAETADKLYADLTAAGVEVLYDDRNEPTGVKFTDADLLGTPIRITVSARNIKNGELEVKRRDSEEAFMIPLDSAVEKLKELIAQMFQEINDKVVEVPFT